MIAVSVLKIFAFLKNFSNDQLVKLEPLGKRKPIRPGTSILQR